MFDHLKCNKLLLALSFSLIVGLTFIYGFVPGLHVSDFVQGLATIADMQSLINHGFFSYLQNTGYPLGAPFTGGLPTTYLATFLAIILRLTPYTAYCLSGIIIIIVSFSSLTVLCKKLGADKYIAIAVSFLFLLLSFNYGQVGYGSTMFGFMLLPAYLLTDYFYFDYFQKYEERTVKKTLFLTSLYIAVKVISLFICGYTFTIAATFSSLYLVFYCIKSFIETKGLKQMSAPILGFIAAYGIAVFLYYTYIPGVSSYGVMPVDFFRAEGVDIFSLLIPPQGYSHLLDVAGISRNYGGPFAFYGDGNQVLYNYLGYSVVSSFITSVFAIRNKKNLFIKTLLVAGVIAFFLSLGPSVKFYNVRPNFGADIQTITFQDYLMPKEAALFDTHTGFLYQHIPGLKMMRAVYRWILFPKLVMFIIISLGLSALIAENRKWYRYLVFFLIVLMIAEIFPNLKKLNARYSANFSKKQALDQSLIGDLGRFVHKGDKIFFVSSENDYLSSYMCSTLDLTCYNVSGDKNQVLSNMYWPKEIKEMRQYQNINENAFSLMKSGDLDKLVLPYFNLRWDAYSWPPTEDEVEKAKIDFARKFDYHDKHFQVRYSKYFAVVTLNMDYIIDLLQNNVVK